MFDMKEISCMYIYHGKIQLLFAHFSNGEWLMLEIEYETEKVIHIHIKVISYLINFSYKFSVNRKWNSFPIR